MLTLQIEFTAGRYHGTRWGTHVNEADIDWPPSPWRILRALLAVGYGKHGWGEPAPEQAQQLIHKLADTQPVYHLPTGATPAHTRHYMPQYATKTSKIFDNFLHIGRGRNLYVSWPVQLSTDEQDLIDRLVSQLTYLGRAESWVDVTRVSKPAGLLCTTEGGPGKVPIPLLCPMATAKYAGWRSEETVKQAERLLANKTRNAEDKSKKPPSKLTKSDQKKVQSLFPESVIDALSRGTGTLRGQGWSHPPGSEEQVYWRPEAAVDTAPMPARSVTRRDQRPTLALYEVSSDTVQGTVLPALARVLDRTDFIHKVLVTLSDGVTVPTLSGKTADGEARKGHGHAHILALPAQGYHRSASDTAGIQRFVVWAPEGFDEPSQAALLRLKKLYTKNAELTLQCAGLGHPEDLRPSEAAFAVGTVWRSVTPYVCPRYLKARGKNGLEGQVRTELAQRGFDVPEEVLVETKHAQNWQSPGAGAPAVFWRKFRLDRGKHRPKTAIRFGIQLRFAKPQAGPITLGYASHFGLGLFEVVAP
jgi:CRISPR-associated protein Csb2